jgi:hypothetical protein
METKNSKGEQSPTILLLKAKIMTLVLPLSQKEFQSQTIVKIIVEIDEISLENG